MEADPGAWVELKDTSAYASDHVYEATEAAAAGAAYRMGELTELRFSPQ